tara:strand:+ start:1640 stop:3112 length:1473 start_codon:yes stop_codon:yes gene_type:complete
MLDKEGGTALPGCGSDECRSAAEQNGRAPKFQVDEAANDFTGCVFVAPQEGKRMRALLEKDGIFDASRKIGKIKLGSPSDKGDGRRCVNVNSDNLKLASTESSTTAAAAAAAAPDAVPAPDPASAARAIVLSVSPELSAYSLCLALPVTTEVGSTIHQQQQYTVAALPFPLAPSAAAIASSGTPAIALHSAVMAYLTHYGLPTGLAAASTGDKPSQVPQRWERHGDLVVLPSTAFRGERWHSTPMQRDALYDAVCGALNATRLARQAPIDPGGRRESRAVLLKGDSGVVTHCDNGISYGFDVTLCMFSRGNISEKLRVASLPARDEVVVDLFAGIGYFTLPYLVHAGAAHVHACEWNPHAMRALSDNLRRNGISEDQYTLYEGDNRELAPHGVADRVNMGLIPTSRGSWRVGLRALRPERGGWLHVHENITSHAVGASALRDDLAAQGRSMAVELASIGPFTRVDLRHVERVKSYAPRIYHVVYDMECRP